ncbi:nucleotidyltransferase domain-containing protein [Candidatus Woesearchaeota archaeon]|nr:nucleotidyltransferase domain-containing protein [Candidatus Woesearchaeota archaeon]
MDKKKSLVKNLKAFKQKACRNIRISNLILFGSYATGKTHRWSDVDLIVVSPDFRGMNFFQRGAKMYGYWHLKKPVDFLCFTPEEFQRKRDGITIVNQALKEGVAI